MHQLARSISQQPAACSQQLAPLRCCTLCSAAAEAQAQAQAQARHEAEARREKKRPATELLATGIANCQQVTTTTSNKQQATSNKQVRS
jgi:hypothetical protein